MSKLRYIIILTLCLLPALTWAQRRYSANEYHEKELASQRGFSTKDVENSTDVLFGLHASEYAGAHHLIGFSAEGSWSSFVSPMPASRVAPCGGAAGFHLLYEFQYNGFLLQTGLGVAYQKVFTNIADTAIYHPGMTDTWSSILPAQFTLKHSFTERQDMSQQAYGQIPLYFGHYFFGPQGIGYFLAGVHATYAFWGNTRQKTLISTSGLYERYVGVWEEMDNHGFRKDVPAERTGSQLKLKFDLMAHAEIGYEYNTRQSARDYRLRPSDRLDGRLRVAAFAEFGMLNICPNTKNVFYGIPDETIYDFTTYRMDHIFSTADAKAFWMRNLFVGVRLTFLFGFQPQEHCILCDPWRH